MKNRQLIKLLYFLSTILLITSCTDMGGILEIAVKDEINNLNSISEIPLTSKKETTTINKPIIGTKDTIVSPRITPNPIYKIGDPYEINDIWYYPERDLKYNFSGIASWYGDKFHGKLTANGEIFNKNIVRGLGFKKVGAKRLVLAQMNIGAADSSSYFWKPGWRQGQPVYINDPTSGNPDKYYVQFWYKAWQDLITSTPKSYVYGIFKQGFDGVVISGVNSYQYFEGSE